jgi:hypothetical protein
MLKAVPSAKEFHRTSHICKWLSLRQCTGEKKKKKIKKKDFHLIGGGTPKRKQN